MKKTTYILLGVVMAGFAIITLVAGIAWAYSEPAASRHWILCGETVYMEIPSCKVLRFESREGCAHSSSELECLNRRVFFEKSQLKVVPSETPSGRFTFSAELLPFLSVQSLGDTCLIQFTITDEIRHRYTQSDYESMFIQLGQMQLLLPNAVQQLAVDWNSLTTELSLLQRDSLLLQGNSSFGISHCQVGVLQLEAEQVYLKSGVVDQVNLDLDRVYDWNVQADSCQIGVEHLMGDGVRHHLLQKGDCDELRWTPKSNRALLEIRVDCPVVLKPLNSVTE